MIKDFFLLIRQKKTTIFQVVVVILLLLSVSTVGFFLQFQQEFDAGYLEMEVYLDPLGGQLFGGCGPWSSAWFVDQTSPDTSDLTIGQLNMDRTGEPDLLGTLADTDQWSTCGQFMSTPVEELGMPFFNQSTSLQQLNEDLYQHMKTASSYYKSYGNAVSPPDYLTDTSQWVPNAAITFQTVSSANGQLAFSLQTPTCSDQDQCADSMDSYFPYEVRVPGIGDTRQMMIHLMERAFVKASHPGKTPHQWLSSASNFNAGSSVAPYMAFAYGLTFLFLPLAVSLHLPIYVFRVVLERRKRLTEFSKLMGLRMTAYWTGSFLFDYSVHLFYCALAIIFGYGFQMSTFKQSGGPAILLFLLWGLAQVPTGYVISAFFKEERTATIATYLLCFFGEMLAVCLNLFVFPLQRAPWWYMWYPPFTFVRGIYLIELGGANQVPVQFLSPSTGPSSEMAAVYMILAAQAVIFFLLSIYIDLVMPKEWGNQRSPLFPILWLVDKCRSTVGSGKSNDGYSAIADEEEVYLDPESADRRYSVKLRQSGIAEEARKATHDESYYLRCIDITKRYGKKLALDHFYLAMPESGECFGLLGENGSGKTTLISILTGMIKPTSGRALVNNRPSHENLLGFCPQHDILWDDLTPEEHMAFYFRVKGFRPSDYNDQPMHQAIASILDQVSLTSRSTVRTSELSGGMKRKLSISISLVANPQLVLLDEPTTGLDVDARREIWDILEEVKKGRSMMLTTHIMEEADTLCSRIGILKKGRFLCVASGQELKQIYGSAYELGVTTTRENAQFVAERIVELFPTATLQSSYSGVLQFFVPQQDLKFGHLFHTMKRVKQELGIREWGINQCGLNQVFLAATRAADVPDIEVM